MLEFRTLNKTSMLVKVLARDPEKPEVLWVRSAIGSKYFTVFEHKTRAAQNEPARDGNV